MIDIRNGQIIVLELSLKEKNRRYYYIQQFKLHEDTLREEENRRRRELAQTRKNEIIDNMDLALKAIWYNVYTFDFLSIICLGIWIVFMPLKLDGIVDWSWHIIYFPMYIIFIHFLCGIITLDLISLFYADDGQRTFRTKKIDKGTSFMNLFSTNQMIRGAVYFSSAALLSFYLLIAEYHQSHSFPEHLVWIPLWLLFFGWVIILCCGCGSKKHLYEFACKRDCERYWLLVLWLYLAWLCLFVWAKATDLAAYTWAVALTPVWIFFICGLVLAVVGLFYCCCNGGGRESRNAIALFSLGYIAMLGPILAWLALISENLDAQIYTGNIVRPWVVTFIPGYVIFAVIFVMRILFQIIF